MYKPKDNKTPHLFPELFPLGGGLNSSNRWLRMRELVPWDEIETIYMRYHSRLGRPAKDARLVCGLLIVKRLEGYSYERAVMEFCENPYVQAFCGFDTFVTDTGILDPGLVSRARKKLGEGVFDSLERELFTLVDRNRELRDQFARFNPYLRERRSGFTVFAPFRDFFKKLFGFWR